ncbi:hypothetical protein AB0N26_29345 [Streptomyces cellulosae]
MTTTALPSGNGCTDTRTYDAVGRLASVTTAKSDSALASWTLKHDAAGQPTQLDTVRKDEAQPPQYYGSYTYNAAGELTQASSGLIRQMYTCDALGNYTGNGSTASTQFLDTGYAACLSVVDAVRKAFS